ncbi:MAG: helix-turn-helix domain-containing protein, partial [Terriglobia bacterium]
MPRKSTRPKLTLLPNELELLGQLRKSQTAARRDVQRAQVLWLYPMGESIAAIMRAVQMTRKSVAKWINKALNVGVAAGLQDTPHGSPPKLTEEAKAWVVHLACSKPKDFGYAAELWTRPALAQHVRRQAVAAGQRSLARASKATVHRILAAQPLRPHKVTYDLQRRDPAFESKMREGLLVYQAVALQNQQAAPGEPSLKVITVSVDEKPGVQA